jgi:uncharacterized protein
MKKIHFSIAFLLLMTSSFSWSSANEQSSFFWSASKEGKKIYLLGVTHSGWKNQYPIPQKITSAFDESSLLLLEAKFEYMSSKVQKEWTKDLAEVTDLTSLNSALNTPYCNEKINIEDFIKKSDYVLNNELGTIKTSFLLEKPMYFWLVQFLFLTPNSSKAKALQRELELGVGIDPMESYEDYFAAKTIQSKRKLKGMDGEQFMSLEKLSDVEKCDLVVGALEARVDSNFHKRALESAVSTLKAYMQNDTANILRLSHSEQEAYPDLLKASKKWFAYRNVRMMERILLNADKSNSPIFVAVGGAHLFGEDGIVELLRKQGFELMPILVEK